MTIIFQGNNFWIESFNIARVSVAAGATDNDTHNLERDGVFLGGTICLDVSTTVTGAEDLGVFLRNVDNSELTFGQEITNVRSSRTNGGSGAIEMGAHILIFLRKKG